MRVAIVGTGYIARVHAKVAGELGGALVGVCGRTLGAAQSFSAAPAYDNFERMLIETKPDVVHVCTPNWLHAEQAIAAFAYGAHVVCEKPLATSSDEAKRMIEAAERARRLGFTMYNYRGYPLIETIRRRVQSGDLGTIWRVGGCYLSEDVHAAEKYVWHFSRGTVGPAFALMDLGVHWFDLVEYVTGRRIREVTAQFATHQPRRVWRGRPGEGPRPARASNFQTAASRSISRSKIRPTSFPIRWRRDRERDVSALSIGHPNSIRISLDGSELRHRLAPAGARLLSRAKRRGRSHPPARP